MSKRGNNEGSIYWRKDGRWVAALNLGYQGGRRNRKHYFGRTRQEAAQKLQRAQRALADGGALTSDRQTVSSLLEIWLRDSATERVRPRTLERYEGIVRLHLIPALGHIRLNKLTPAHVDAMMNRAFKDGASPRSVAQHRAVLQSPQRRDALGLGESKHREPCRAAARARTRHPRPNTKGRQGAPPGLQGDRLEALFTVALTSGLRQGEALGLRWSDLDLEVGVLTVRRTPQRISGSWRLMEPKTARSHRTIPLPAPVAASLREHRARQLKERLRAEGAWEGQAWGDLVFADELGRPLSGFHVLRRFKALLTEAGLPTMRYHDLRHGAASLMAAQGVPARVAMELLGHSQISTTMNIYTHVTADAQRDAVERVGAALW